jgi:glycosyltransferase involved in cell wall biosynthesis
MTTQYKPRIDFFFVFGNHVEKTPLGEAIRKYCENSKIFSRYVKLSYKNSASLLIFGISRLILVAARFAVDSMKLKADRPFVAVAGSDIQVLMYGLFRSLLLSKRPKIVFLTFIFVLKNVTIANYFRRLYYNIVLDFTDMAICHSRTEIDRYAALFPRHAHKFVFIRWGGHMTEYRPATNHAGVDGATAAPCYAISAGRSSRDYTTLDAAARGLPCPIKIICDNAAVIAQFKDSEQIEVLPRCYGDNYVRELQNALFVVIPLSADEVSAGQMVLTQSMALSKPIIITRTRGIEDYVAEGVDALLVERADVAAMRAAMRSLLEEPALRHSLARAARHSYETHYTIDIFIGQVIAAIDAFFS